MGFAVVPHCALCLVLFHSLYAVGISSGSLPFQWDSEWSARVVVNVCVALRLGGAWYCAVAATVPTAAIPAGAREVIGVHRTNSVPCLACRPPLA